MAKNTVALIAKLHVPELPFLESFLRYYLRLGVEHFYLLDTSEPTDNRIPEYLTEWFGPWDFFITLEKSTWEGHDLQGIYDQLIGRIKERWMLIADIDEFLYLPTSKTIQEFLSKYSADYFWLPWVMVPSDEWAPPKKNLRGFRYSGQKYIVRTDQVLRLKDHSFKPRQRRLPWRRLSMKDIRRTRRAARDKHQVRHDAVSIHYSARGIRDVLLRVAHQKFGGKKASTRDSWGTIQSVEELPIRLRNLAWQCLQPRKQKIDVHYQIEIDDGLLDELVAEKFSQNEIEHLLDLYARYKDQLAKEMKLVENGSFEL